MPVLLLNPYVDAILALALAFLASRLIPALFRPLFSIPGVGHYIESGVQAMAQQVSYACGGIASGVSDALGVSFHAVARLIDTVTEQIEENARALQAAVSLVVPVVATYEGVKWLLNHISHARAGDQARIKRLEQEYHGIDEQIKQIDATLAKLHFKGIDAQLKSLTADINLVEGQTIPAINTRVGTLDGAIGDLEGFLGLPTTLPQTKWLAAFATAALAAAGLGGLNCNSNPFKNNSNACGLWGDLSSLLALAAALGFAYDLPGIVKFMESVIGDVTDLVDKAA